MSGNQLVNYEAARTALAKAHSLDEVKSIRDKAQALAAYARQARDTDLIKMATEIKVRAERNCGERLAEMEKAKGAANGTPGPGRGNVVAQRDRVYDQPRTLSDLGISKDQSSRYQRLAAMPEEHFETAIETAKAAAGEVTSAHMLRLASELKATRDLQDQLREARATRDAESRDADAWRPFVVGLKLLQKDIAECGRLPECPPHLLAEMARRWPKVERFFSTHLRTLLHENTGDH